MNAAPTETRTEAALNAPPPLPSPERLQQLLFDAARMGREDVIEALVHAGADIEARDERGHTPLVLASYHGMEAATATLLRLGADPDTLGDNGSALMGVAFKGHVAIADVLLRSGADPNLRNAAGQTSLMMAALFGRAAVVTLLLEAGASPDLQDITGTDAAALARSQGNEALATMLESAAEPVVSDG
ncbi:ankyrin repeat domain-containing protein [Novosphingobium silvae]